MHGTLNGSAGKSGDIAERRSQACIDADVSRCLRWLNRAINAGNHISNQRNTTTNQRTIPCLLQTGFIGNSGYIFRHHASGMFSRIQRFSLGESTFPQAFLNLFQIIDLLLNSLRILAGKPTSIQLALKFSYLFVDAVRPITHQYIVIIIRNNHADVCITIFCIFLAFQLIKKLFRATADELHLSLRADDWFAQVIHFDNVHDGVVRHLPSIWMLHVIISFESRIVASNNVIGVLPGYRLNLGTKTRLLS